MYKKSKRRKESIPNKDNIDECENDPGCHHGVLDGWQILENYPFAMSKIGYIESSPKKLRRYLHVPLHQHRKAEDG